MKSECVENAYDSQLNEISFFIYNLALSILISQSIIKLNPFKEVGND